MGRRTEDINWIATPEIATEIRSNREGKVAAMVLAVRVLALDVFEYPNVDGSIEYLFRFEKGTGKVLEGQKALKEVEAMMEPTPDPTEFRYSIPERLLTTRAHAPINRLMTKMDKLGDVTIKHLGGLKVVTVTVPAESLKRAQKVNAELRSLLATGGE